MRNRNLRARGSVALLIAATAAAAVMLFAAAAPSAEPPRYRRTVSDAELRDIVEGRSRIDESDPRRCEKVRDLCLEGLCVTTERERAVPACWDYCTKAAHEACLAREGLQ